MGGLLLMLAFGVALFGLVLSSQATLGVSVVGIACLLGIAARIAQAAEHRKWDKQSPQKRTAETQPAETAR